MVTVKSSHIVKPAGDTPNVVMYASECDQTKPVTHAPLIYFYRSGNPSVQIFKDSLSKALVIFYPLAGRVHWLDGDRVEIHCNSKGALLLEAESESRVDDYGDFLPTPKLRELIPTVNYYNTPLHKQPLVLAQLTRFACGGISFGFAISHLLVDGPSALHFVREWARIARGEDHRDSPFLDRRVLQLEHPAAKAVGINQTEFVVPPLLIGKSDYLEERKKATRVLMLKLSKDDIQKLRGMANEGWKSGMANEGWKSGGYTRYEAVTGHIWRCATKARGHLFEQQTNLYFPLNFRNRLKPALPPHYFGNAAIRIAATATSGELRENPLSYAASRIRQAVNKATDEYVRLNLAFSKQLPDVNLYRHSHNVEFTECGFFGNPNLEITSWMTLPLYGLDFGWGKEIYAGPGAVGNDGKAYITSSRDDDESLQVALRLQEGYIEAFEGFFNEDIKKIGSIPDFQPPNTLHSVNSTDLPLLAATDCHGGGTALVMVVEYLETTMSRDLLCKFPDNSAFDFDYSQSTIWSPMVARPLIPLAGSRDLGETTINFREVTAKFKRKLLDAVSCNVHCQLLKKRKKREFDVSPIPPSKLTSTPRKGWAKALKAASKHFKKSKKKPQII